MKKLIIFLLTIVFIVGCSEKKEEKKVEVSKESGAIEVVENKNYKEEKVKALAKLS